VRVHWNGIRDGLAPADHLVAIESDKARVTLGNALGHEIVVVGDRSRVQKAQVFSFTRNEVFDVVVAINVLSSDGFDGDGHIQY